MTTLVLSWMGKKTFFLCQAEDGIRDLVRSRGLGDVYKRQNLARSSFNVATCHGMSNLCFNLHLVLPNGLNVYLPKIFFIKTDFNLTLIFFSESLK